MPRKGGTQHLSILAFLLGVAIAATHMTSLRGDAPIGIPELAAVGAAGLSILLRLPTLLGASENSNKDGGFAAAVLFGRVWAGLLVAVTISLLANLSNYLGTSLISIYAPYPFNALIVFAILAEAKAGNTKALFTGYALSGLLFAIGYVAAGDVTSGERFQGLTTNPNQAALFALSTFFASVALLIKFAPASIWIKGLLVAAALSGVLLGVSSQSDAFAISMLIAAGGAGILFTRRIIQMNPDLFLILMLTAVSGLLATYTLFPEQVSDRAEAIILALTYGEQDTVRRILWTNGIEAWRNSPIIGNGPGAWSGISSPFEGSEAHNALIDWLSIAGVVGCVPLLWLLWSIKRLPMRNNFENYIGLIALIAFAMFHFTFRSPAFWFAMFTVYLPGNAKLVYRPWTSVRSRPPTLGR